MTLNLTYDLEQNFLGGADCWRGEKRYAFCFFVNRLINKNFRGYTDSIQYAIFDAKL